MLEVLISILILAILCAGAYYASYQWVNLRHTRDTIADELLRANSHIEELEDRVNQLVSAQSLRDYKVEPQQEKTGWDTFSMRG